MKRRSCLSALGLLAGAAWAQPTSAPAAAGGAFPSRPVTLINPWPPGGTLDAVARAAAQAMQRQSGHPFIVENVAGAASMIGTTRVAGARPDGYTLLWGSSSGLVILPQVNPHVRYHPVNSFEPVGWIGSSPYYVVVAAPSPYRSLRELMADAKARPGQMMVGVQGIGSSPHVTVEALLGAQQVTMPAVPFPGGPETIAALLRGDVSWAVELANGVLPMLKAGRLRVLAVTTPQRLPSVPDVPTVQEALDLPGFESAAWLAVFAPKGTPPDRIQLLNRLIGGALQDPEVVAVLARGGFTAAHATPAELAETVRREYERWGQVIRTRQIKVE